MIVTKMCDWDYWPMDKEENLLTTSLHFNIEKTANKNTRDRKSNKPKKKVLIIIIKKPFKLK